MTGNYTQSASGELTIKLGGPTPGSTHDVLAVTGNAELAGVLRIEVVGGFRPMVDQTFDILTAESVTGEFEEVAGSGQYEITYGSTVVTARVVEAPTSDLAGCEMVDPDAGTGVCGAGACGAGMAMMMPLIVAGLLRTKVRRRRRCRLRG